MFNEKGLGQDYLKDLHEENGKIFGSIKHKPKYQFQYLQRQMNELCAQIQSNEGQSKLQKEMEKEISSVQAILGEFKNHMKEEIQNLKVKSDGHGDMIHKFNSRPVVKEQAVVQAKEFDIKPYLKQIEGEISQMENRIADKMASVGMMETGGETNLQSIVAKMQAEFQRKFKRFTQIDAQMQHFQVEHDFLKKKRWQHEQQQQRQLNLVKQHQLVLQEAVEKAKDIILQQQKALP